MIFKERSDFFVQPVGELDSKRQRRMRDKENRRLVKDIKKAIRFHQAWLNGNPIKWWQFWRR